MQKVVDFLEKYCQWLAVGIAAAFFLLALWQFLPGVSTPVSGTVGGVTYGPGEVDSRIYEEYAVPLQAKIAAPDKIVDKVPQYGTTFVNESAKPPALKSPTITPASFAVRSVEIPEGLVPKENPGGPIDIDSQQVKELPKLPAPLMEPPTTGFAQVAAPAGDGAAPVQPVIAPPAGQPAAPPAVNAKDVTWVRVPYMISTRQVQLAFQQANIPPALMQTGVVRVELIRQRSLAGNQWEAEEVVKAFSVSVPLRTMPAVGSPAQSFLDYMQWAFANQAAIVQPPFFQIVGGEDPNVTKPEETIAVEVFDPTTFPRNGDISKLTPEQRKAVMDARKEAAKTAQPPRGAAGPRGGPPPGAGGPPRGGRRGGGGGGEMAPRIALPAAEAASTPVQLQYPRPPSGMYPPGQRPPGDPGMEDQGMTGENPAVPMPGQAITLPPVPTAPWNVTLAGTGLSDIYGVCYDVDARGDSTYRYRVRYSLANPIFNTQGVAANPQLVQQFELVGEDPTKWTDPIEIAPRSYVFLAAQPLTGATSVRFVIYHWQNGRQHKTIQAVGTGDSIGKPENEIDYRTPWTFVEVRRDPSNNNVFALLMNSEGKERRQVFAVDQASAQQKKLATQVDAANTAAGTASATPAAGRPAPGGAANANDAGDK